MFYDAYEEVNSWGKDLYDHLSNVYEHLCAYCVLFVSKEYADKVWTTRERRSAQARALIEKKEYILPARFDDTAIPGLQDTVAYVDLRDKTPLEFSDLIYRKVGRAVRDNYLPPCPDRLFQVFGIQDDPGSQALVYSHASSFLEALRRMTEQERKAVIDIIRFGCPVELPNFAHINADLLRRLTGDSVPALKRVLGDIRSLGFECSLEDQTEDSKEYREVPGELLGRTEVFYLKWVNLSDLDRSFPALSVAREMIVGATADYCEAHGTEFLKRLDFSQLATATASHETHESQGERGDPNPAQQE